MNFKNSIKRAFTLVEILGAAALITTLATVSVLSVKDSITAGQKASIQRELQGLNTSLANFKSAGGVISEGAGAAEALAELQAGVNLSGSSYSPITSVPELSATIGGTAYELAYDPTAGFSYVPSGENAGEVFAGAGAVDGVGLGGVTYPFDITDPAAVSKALADFANMDPSSAGYQDYLDAFNATSTMNTLPAESLAAIDSALSGEGLIQAGGNWEVPAFDVNDPVAVANAVTMLPSLRSDPDQFRAYVSSLNLALENADPALTSQIQAGLWKEFQLAGWNGALDLEDGEGYRYTYGLGVKDADWSKIDLTGKDISSTWYDYWELPGMNISGEQLSKATYLSNLNLAGMNLTGFDAAGKDLSGVILAGATGLTGAQLNSATTLTGANLNGVNLTGLSFTGRDLSGVDLGGTGVSNADLTAANNVWAAANLTGLDLSDLNFAGAELSNVAAGLVSNGKPWTVTGSQLSQVGNLAGANLSSIFIPGYGYDNSRLAEHAAYYSSKGLVATPIEGTGINCSINFAGFSAAGLNMAGANLSGASITAEQLSSVADISGANFSNTGVTRQQLMDAGIPEAQLDTCTF